MNIKTDKIISILEDQDSIDILKESEKCFRIRANRAALLFGFNSLIRAIRNRLIKIGKPEQVTIDEWKNFYNDLLNDDKMEKSVLIAIRSSQSKYFSINEKLRQEMDYWIDKRNSCAHWKQDTIESELVDVFYSFYLNNIYKFQLGSSINQTVIDLNEIYDKTKNRPGTKPDRVINRIKYSIADEQFKELLKKIYDSYYFMTPDSPIIEIAEVMYSLLDERKLHILNEYLRNNIEWTSCLIEKHSRFINYIFHSSQDFFHIIEKSIQSEDVCRLFVVLKNTKFLNDQDIELFFNSVFELKINIKGNFENQILSEQFTDWLVNKKLVTYLGNSYNWINERVDTLYKVLTFKMPNEETCKLIANYFTGSYSSQWFCERFSYDDSRVKAFNKCMLSFELAGKITIPINLKNKITNNI